MNLKAYKIPADGTEVILGQGNFSLKTVNDLARSIVSSAGNAKVGVAMNDGTTKQTRVSGNDKELKERAGKIAFEVAAGHFFVILMKGAFPINVLNDLNNVHGVCKIFAATANDIEVVIAEADQGPAVLGAVDGYKPEKIETEEDEKARVEKLKKFGYDLG